MSLETALTYVVVSTLMSLTPGPAVLFIVSQAIWRGQSAALRSVAAINVANLIYFALFTAGITAILGLSDTLFQVMKFAGAAYLIWLGIKALRSTMTQADGFAAPARERPFVDGLIVQLTNPKAYMFVGAILPPFIDKHAPIGPQIAVLVGISLVTETSVLGGYALAAGLVRRSANLPKYRLWLERAGGVVLICVGLATALYRRG